MTHFFEKRDSWGNGYALWVLMGMAFVLPIAIWGLTYLHLDNEVQNWVSADSPQTKAFRWYQKHFPSDETVLFVWEDSHLNDPRLEKLAHRLRGSIGSDGVNRDGLKQLGKVRTPRDLIDQIAQRGVTVPEAIARIDGVLVGQGNLRVRLTDVGRNQRDRVIELLQREVQKDPRLGFFLEVLPADNFTGELLPDDTREAVKAEREALLQAGKAGDDSGEASPSDAGSTSETDSPETATASTSPENTERDTTHDFQVRWPGMTAHSEQLEHFREVARNLRFSSRKVAADTKPLIDDCFFLCGAPAAIAFNLSEAGKADRQGTFALVKSIAAEVGVDLSRLHMGGQPVVGAALNRSVQESSWDPDYPWYMLHKRSPIGLSGVVGGVLAFWMLRSLRLSLLVLGVSHFTALISTAVISLSGGSMSMVLVVMPPLLFVTTLSGAIHLANYWKHAATINPQTAVVQAVRTAWMPCIWASLTTAIGLASLMTSSLKPVRAFGMYSAIGTLISLLMILYGLPALLQLFPSRPPKPAEIDHAGWKDFGLLLTRKAYPVMAATLLLGGAFSLGLMRFKTETKVIKYFSPETTVVKDYQFIEQQLGGVVPVDVIVRFDADTQSELKFLERVELIRRIQEKIRGLEHVSGSLSLADFFPRTQRPADNAATAIRAIYARKSSEVEEKVFGPHAKTAAPFLTRAEQGGEFNAPGDELWRITAQVSILGPVHYGTLTKDMDEVCQLMLREAVGKSEEKFRTAKSSVLFHPGTSHLVTGMVPLFLATQEELLKSLIKSFLLAFGMIAMVMMILLRHPVSGMLAMIPNVLPIGAVFGLISWFGVSVDIGTMVTASIALGIAIDGTLHLLTWFRLGLQQGKSRQDAVVQALMHCGPAMWQTSFVVSLGLLMLYPSELTLISRFGWLMAALVSAALLIDVVLTPALLAGPLGMILEKCTPHADEENEAACLLAAAVEQASTQPQSTPEKSAAGDAPSSTLFSPHLVPPPHAVRRIDQQGRTSGSHHD